MELWLFAFLWFVALVIVFHIGEFLVTYLYNRKICSISSLAIQKDYVIAMSAAVIEFTIETYFFPSLKQYTWICYIGIILTIIGEVIRKTGMVTAGMAFTHYIQHHRREGHNLVTNGIYQYIRHPGYLGWFIWAPATQLVLMNPFCTLAFLAVAWYFFYDRIPYEEETLIGMFGNQYIEYRKKTPSYIPFIDSITINKNK
ncbi:hypothetical protein ABK040_009892 [Willaertia magna]